MKLGVVGNGMIVEWLFRDLADVPEITAAALCVREKSREKGQALIKQYGVPKLYTDYATFLKEGEFDTVYLGIANQMHAPYAKQALEAGKHVICEKPFTVTATEARTLADLAKERGLFLWEAFKIPYSPLFAAVKKHLPDIGQVRMVQCNYSRISSRFSQYAAGVVLPAFDPACAGGCLYDINLYNLHFTSLLYGKPRRVQYFANRGFNGVDLSGTVVLEYDGFQGVCMAAKDSSSPCYALIQGTKGYLRVEGPASAGKSLQFVSLDGSASRLAEDPNSGSLSDELREFARQLSDRDVPSCRQMLEHSLVMMEIVDAAQESAQSGMPICLTKR